MTQPTPNDIAVVRNSIKAALADGYLYTTTFTPDGVTTSKRPFTDEERQHFQKMLLELPEGNA